MRLWRLDLGFGGVVGWTLFVGGVVVVLWWMFWEREGLVGDEELFVAPPVFF